MSDKCACLCGMIYERQFNFCPNCGRTTEDNIRDTEKEQQENEEKEVNTVETKKQPVGFEYEITDNSNKSSSNSLGISKDEMSEAESSENVYNDKNNNKEIKSGEFQEKYIKLEIMEKTAKVALIIMAVLTILIYCLLAS